MPPPASMHLLLVEDDASDACLLQNALDGACPGEFNVSHALSIEAALPCLAAQAFDAALLDLSLPGSSELEALQHLHNAAPRLPVVILTGYDDEALALSSLKRGAQDYLVKEQAGGEQIKRAIRYAIERKRFEDSLTQLANYDALTGLANRSLFESRLGMALARARRSGGKVAVFFLDLDRFKQVNDQFGHEAGDALLKSVAQRLSQSSRESDTVARFGGDEFAILLEGSIEPRHSAFVAQKMIDALRTPFILGGGEASVGASVGIAIGGDGSSAEEMLKQADDAMYRAKAAGTGSYLFYTAQMQQETAQRIHTENDLVAAIRHRRSLRLYYQPKIDLASGRLTGAEALIRWHHPVRGLMAPAEFLPFLSPAMATDLDRWVVETACFDLRRWEVEGLAPVQVSIHLANRQWEQMDNINALLALIGKTSRQIHYLAIEVDEPAMLGSAGGFDALMRAREAGIGLHLNNFGAGVCSLTLLARCPLDTVKIDRGLTSGMGQCERHNALVKALIDLSHRFGMKVIAEGVETMQQQAALLAMRCDQIQGNIISRPLPANDFSKWSGDRRATGS